MSTYIYKSFNDKERQTTIIKGITFTFGVSPSFDSDQLPLNEIVPEKLDRYVDGILSNLDLVIPFTPTNQDKYNVLVSGGGAGTGVISTYTAAQLAAMALAGTLTPEAIYAASDTDARYHADDASTMVEELDAAELAAIKQALATGGFFYLGAVASEAAMTTLDATVGAECLRSDLGTGGLRYELTALPASSAANWQAVQGTIANGTLITVALVGGKLPRRLLVSVDNGNQITLVVGGVTQPVLIETVSGQPHEIIISDDPGAAQPTTLTLQRTSGSGTTSAWSLES